MNRNNQDGEVPSLAILRDQLQTDNLKNKSIHALQDAGLIQDQRLQRYLLNYKKNYTPNQAPHYQNNTQAYYYHNSEEYVNKVEEEITRVLSEAMQNGQIQIIQHAIGLQQNQDMSGYLVEYRKLYTFLENNSLSLLIGNSDTGDGKTATMISLVETMLASPEYDVGLINLKSFAEPRDDVIYIETFTEYLRYCIDHPNQRKVLALDEISSFLSGYPSDRADVEKFLRPFLRKKRKSPFNTSIIGVAHSYGDVHPVWRDDSQADFLTKFGDTQKQRQKQFRIYRKLNDSSNELYNKQIDITDMNLPKSKWESDEDSIFRFGDENELLELAYEIKNDGYGDILNLIRILEDDDDVETNEGKPYSAIKCKNCGRTAEQYKNDNLNPIIDTGYCWDHMSDQIEDEYLDNPEEFNIDDFNENNESESIFDKKIIDLTDEDIDKLKKSDEDVSNHILEMVNEIRNDVDIDD